MIDHINLRVQDFPRAIAFYRAALAPIGYEVIMEFPNAAGLGAAGKPDLWIMSSDRPTNPVHVAFSADRGKVDAFHAAALTAGGADNGPPGVRADYHPTYYAAFVHDPEGNNIEVVCHDDPNGPRAAGSGPAATKPRKAAKAGKAAKARPSAARRPAAKAMNTNDRPTNRPGKKPANRAVAGERGAPKRAPRQPAKRAGSASKKKAR